MGDYFNLQTAEDRQAESLQRYFQNQSQNHGGRFEWVGLVGAGAFGICVRLREHFADGRPSRDLVLKQANSKETERELRREIRRLQRISGGLHIVRQIVLENSPFLDFETTEEFNVHPSRRSGARERYEASGYLLGPLLVMQPLENGTLRNFLNRAETHKVARLPNRLLWRFFLCLVRGCVAMAYPRSSENEQSTEIIPATRQAPSDFTHTDWHAYNVMLGEITEWQLEHQITPILKLIDFGVWSLAERFNLDYSDPDEKGVAANIFSVGKLMLDMITGESLDIFGPKTWFQVQVQVQQEGDDGGETTNTTTIRFMTHATSLVGPQSRNKYSALDPEIASLVAHCLAENAEDRPELGGLLNQLLRGLARSAADYDDDGTGGGNSQQETDEYIRGLVHRVLNEAAAFSGDVGMVL